VIDQPELFGECLSYLDAIFKVLSSSLVLQTQVSLADLSYLLY